VVNKNVDFSHFVNFMLITGYHSVFKGDVKKCVPKVFVQAISSRDEIN